MPGKLQQRRGHRDHLRRETFLGLDVAAPPVNLFRPGILLALRIAERFGAVAVAGCMLVTVDLSSVHRYGVGARFYDVLSGERLVYRTGRVAAIELLALGAGDRVLDVGCGTGLSLPLLVDAVGPDGRIVGVDASSEMLERARRRVVRNRWEHVDLVRGAAGDVARLAAGPFDAALFTYSLAIVDDWRRAWRQTLTLVRPGGRIAVVDTALPIGGWRILAPVARLAMFTGGVHASRQVWRMVAADTVETTHRVLNGGHVHVAVGSVVANDSRPSGTVPDPRDQR
ncbi:methyltransferase domain-containing protein [Kribbella qitaiheensis]|uniref:Methyltransferase domain-containing protein n=1 Tax=Kribbella qitaiheensis TaxID=1544730 RepID=A0A7G6WW76_9ACTN|nr:methyltransferase domain-containing protein [Kribbella qitaiheensis]QNE18241.1 methyltransferase domain-containing protein [Kribbella qitaiheensis]